MKKRVFIIVIVAAIFALAGCGNNPSQQSSTMNHTDMKHSSSGEVPKGLIESKNPTFSVGSEVIIQSEHMPGMNGAEATIVGAYDTIVYAVSYTPTTGGEPLKNHKWVIHEEIENAGSEALKPGAEVTLEADHMPGMKEAVATIDTAEQTTVYIVDYNPTTGGETVKNHMWVTESELSTK
ncbi:YdhK family protein [Paenibacillus wynnii]|uniref:YdhK family protein n=1 Tax=Paenibacillus wynnii TaxID=268407 RepID=UPI0027906BF3|nr:YdhK family protein [Paenibacillus wynnii]MDQ0193801.1 hypothetical protein [Paenibacillus wynnii]